MQPEVVEMPKWALAAQSTLDGSLSETTHISSQEESEWIQLDEEWIELEHRPPFWVRTLQSKHNGAIYRFPQESFTCVQCPQQIQTGWHTSEGGNTKISISTERCQSCNVRYKRWQRVRRAFKWLRTQCDEIGCRPKFVTLTETLRTSSTPFSQEEIEQDRFRMKEMFRRTRASSAWPDKFA